jgi:hypothetical protein
MKKIVTILLIAFAIVSCQGNKTQIASVDDVLNNPNKFISQETKVEGIVSQVNANKQQFSIIGEKEFDKCGIDKCNANEQLPIRFNSELPKLGDKIEVFGQITKIEEGFIYEAKTIRNIKDIPTE